jgi:hypothetical protein
MSELILFYTSSGSPDPYPLFSCILSVSEILNHRGRMNVDCPGTGGPNYSSM